MGSSILVEENFKNMIEKNKLKLLKNVNSVANIGTVKDEYIVSNRCKSPLFEKDLALLSDEIKKKFLQEDFLVIGEQELIGKKLLRAFQAEPKIAPCCRYFGKQSCRTGS